jgi:hypothetical protein
MRLFDLLRTLDPNLAPAQCKVHLASHSSVDDPLDAFFEGKFEDWQALQTKKNFERAHIVSLIQMPERHRWLFAGCYDSHGCSRPKGSRHFIYKTTPRPQTHSLVGRLIARFERTGRQSYLVGENWVDALEVAEIRPQRMAMAEFPGYSKIQLSKNQLDIIVGQRIASWRAALSHLAGIYVIADRTTGRLYVGSATGEEGIWSRWTSYSENGHGGNKELRALLKERGSNHAANFVFGILEFAGTHGDDLLARESYWKDLLLTREFGLNAN